jgi:hypothetical protein
MGQGGEGREYQAGVRGSFDNAVPDDTGIVIFAERTLSNLFASLDYLRRYPVDRIKIAQQFMIDPDGDWP